MSQLVLPLRLADNAVFATFHTAGNEPVVSHLRTLVDAGEGHGAWLAGAPSTGKSHLLQAVCDHAGDRAVYLPLRELGTAGTDLLEGLGRRPLVCVDDIDRVAGARDWEQALFELCNDSYEAGGQLVVSARTGPREAGFGLADLQSRLARLPVFRLHALDEPQRVAALQLRARHRGLELPAETARFMLNRSRRDMRSLYGLLDRLDLEALRAQRRLTIPFVRDVLDSG